MKTSDKLEVFATFEEAEKAIKWPMIATLLNPNFYTQRSPAKIAEAFQKCLDTIRADKTRIAELEATIDDIRLQIIGWGWEQSGVSPLKMIQAGVAKMKTEIALLKRKKRDAGIEHGCLTSKLITNEHDGHLQGWGGCGGCEYCIKAIAALNEPTHLGESLVAAVNDPEVKAAMEAEKP